jgi:hypothetical protein
MYTYYISKLWEKLINNILIYHTEDSKADLGSFDFGTPENLDILTKNNAFHKDELVLFKQRIVEEKRDMFKKIKTFLEEHDDDTAYYGNYQNYVNIYEERIKPLFKGNIYPVLVILFREINNLDSAGYANSYINILQHGYNKMNIGNDRNKTNKEFLENLYLEFIFRVLEINTEKKPGVKRLSYEIMTIFKHALVHLKRCLKELTTINFKKIWKQVSFYARHMLHLILNKSPIEIYFAVRIMTLFRANIDDLLSSDLMTKPNKIGNELNFMKSLLYASSLLGGKSKMETKSQMDFLFKLANTSNMLLV